MIFPSRYFTAAISTIASSRASNPVVSVSKATKVTSARGVLSGGTRGSPRREWSGSDKVRHAAKALRSRHDGCLRVFVPMAKRVNIHRPQPLGNERRP